VKDKAKCNSFKIMDSNTTSDSHCARVMMDKGKASCPDNGGYFNYNPISKKCSCCEKADAMNDLSDSDN
jgi:hypothetical protein